MTFVFPDLFVFSLLFGCFVRVSNFDVVVITDVVILVLEIAVRCQCACCAC